MFLWCGLLFIGCFDDETIHADYVAYGRAYDTTSTDPVVKFISQYYYKYNKVIILDPLPGDYMFNFQSKHDVNMVQPPQDQESLLKRLKFLEEMFLKGYSDDVKNDMFPNIIILADFIKNLNTGEEVDIYTTTYYIAFLVNDEMLNKSEQEKEEQSRNWNKTFLDYCTKKIDWTVPEEFYLYPTDAEFNKNENWWIPIPGATELEPADINIVWERGYPTGKWDWNFKKDAEGNFVKDETGTMLKEYGYAVSSSKEGYLSKFFEFLFTTPQETIDKAIADHEKLRKAHDVLDKALKDDFGIDYRTMMYKAKE